jgi:hypothetical protein
MIGEKRLTAEDAEFAEKNSYGSQPEIVDTITAKCKHSSVSEMKNCALWALPAFVSDVVVSFAARRA